MTSKNMNIENVRLSAELSLFYNKLLQIVYVSEQRSKSEIVSDLVELSDSIRETIGEIQLYSLETEGERDNG